MQTIPDYLKALADKAPTPGGGAAAALTAAQSAALLAMAARVSKCDHEDIVKMDVIRDVCFAFVAKDAAAFEAVMQAFRSKDQSRMAATSEAAARVPLALMHELRQIVDLANKVSHSIKDSIMSDLLISKELARAAAAACYHNVMINLAPLAVSTAAELREAAAESKKFIYDATTDLG